MPFVQGSALDKVCEGSMENRLNEIHAAIGDFLGESPVNIVATHEKHALVFNEDGCLLKVTFGNDKEGRVVVASAKPTDVVPVIEDDGVPGHVAKELSGMVRTMMEGNEVSRNQFREVASLLKRDEDYWLSDVLEKIEESSNGEWRKMYESNEERIRTSLYGSIREIEAVVPKTRYASFGVEKLENFSEELNDSISELNKVVKVIVDECSKMVFHEEDDFSKVVCKSLLVDAQGLSNLLGKAAKLMNPGDMVRMAEAHDNVADRVKVMRVVSRYMSTKAQSTKNEE